MKKVITKSQIKNIGKRLRNTSAESLISENDLNYLNLWRLHHDPSLKYHTDFLKTELTKINLKKQDCTVTQRLKRIHSIILKLNRFENMQLSMMEDIAGARVVLPNSSQVYELIELLKLRKSKHKIIKINNYISRPKTDGYRSAHLIYKVKKELDIFIEVQIRSHLQHIWATGVEVFGTLESTSFKTGSGNEEWRTFFKLLSSYFANKENATLVEEHEILSKPQLKVLLINKIKNLKIIEQLNTYTAMHTSNWREKRSKGRSGKFALLVLDSEKSNTEVRFYAESKISEALKDYANIEKVHHSNPAINAVLVNLSNMENLEQAYPNYFMNTKALSNYLSKIVLGDF